MGKACEEFGAVDGFEGVKEGIIANPNGIEEFGPSSPGCKPLLVRISLISILAGIFSSHTEMKDEISGGSGAIMKAGGSCLGTQESKRLVCSSSVT